MPKKQLTEYEQKLVDMQFNLRQNNEIMSDTFKDLDNWSKEIKVKEKKLLEDPESVKNANKGLPPIRSLATTKKKKKIKKPTGDENNNKAIEQKKPVKKSTAPRDARAWDKLDVDKLCEEVDNQPESEYEYTTDEEWEDEQRKIRANWEKERGNQFFKDNMFNEAIQCYTKAIEMEPYNHVYPANRAMALMKQEKYAAAELDCSLSLSLDPKYVKAIHRRATCRRKLKKFEEAKKDLEALLKLEPNNKLAQTEMNQVLQLIDTRQLVFPVNKKEQDKSKKELKRILIEEINDDSAERAVVEKQQEEIKQRMQFNSADEKLFDVTKKSMSDKPKIEEISETFEKKVSIKKTIGPVVEKASKPIVSIAKKVIPEVPKNGYQFRKDWQLLSSNSEDLETYFKKIPQKQYSNLFMNGLESDYLSKILVMFKNLYLNDSETLYLHMKSLAEVKRFKTQIMFLSSSDVKIIKELLDSLQSSAKIPKADMELLTANYTD